VTERLIVVDHVLFVVEDLDASRSRSSATTPGAYAPMDGRRERQTGYAALGVPSSVVRARRRVTNKTFEARL